MDDEREEKCVRDQGINICLIALPSQRMVKKGRIIGLEKVEGIPL